MTAEQKRQEKLGNLAYGISKALHESRISNAELIDVIAVVLCNEAKMAQLECGERGTSIIFERFLKGCSRALPHLTFHVVERLE